MSYVQKCASSPEPLPDGRSLSEGLSRILPPGSTRSAGLTTSPSGTVAAQDSSPPIAPLEPPAAPKFYEPQNVAVAGFPERHLRTDVAALKKNVNWALKCGSLHAMLKDGGVLCALIGGRGRGKTQMAVTAVANIARRRPELVVRYRKLIQVFLEIRAGFGTDGATEEAVIKKYVEPDILVLDEIQERSQSDWENRVFTHIVDRRYDRPGKSTILIGNVARESTGPVDPLRECVGDSIYSRMIETGGIIEFPWASFRG